MKSKIKRFETQSEDLSLDLIKIYKQIEITKKLKTKEINRKVNEYNAKESFIDSLLQQQPTFTNFFGEKKSHNKTEKNSISRDGPISTVQDFKKFLKANGIISHLKTSR